MKISSYRQREYQVILELSGNFPVNLLCGKMGIQRGSFYNWKHTLAHALSSKQGDRMTYLSGLDDLIGLKKQYPQYEMVLHSDQGAVYASKAFNGLLPMYSITRSMSRAGIPTDNAAMESINGWTKAETFMDLHVTGESPVEQEVTAYITFFNTARQFLLTNTTAHCNHFSFFSIMISFQIKICRTLPV